MKPKHLALTLLLLIALTACDDEKSEANAKKLKEQEAAHKAFMGEAPKPSKPFNILDYTKSPNPPNSGAPKSSDQKR